MKYYTETIPFEIGKLLKDIGYWEPGCKMESQYNNPCYVSYKISGEKYYENGVIASWDDIVPTPTYADVFDWFLSRDISICIDHETLHPLTWTWNIQLIGEKLNQSRKTKQPCLTITEDIYDDFKTCFDSAISIAVKIFKKYDTNTNN